MSMINSSKPHAVRTNLIVFVVIISFCFLLYAFYIEVRRDGNGVIVGETLKKEFKSIMPPDKTQLVGSIKEVFKNHIAGISADYSSSLPINEIKKLYSKELADKGWIFIGDETMTGLSKFRSLYCKNEYEAYFELSNQSWLTYSFGVHWDSNTLLRGNCKK
jgi:hypothetical protein